MFIDKHPNAIFLSRNMAGYNSAMYQQDTISAFAQETNPYFYGPGFPGYCPTDTIHDVIAKSSVSPDLIVVGHSWLSDDPSKQVDSHPRICLNAVNIPKALILNKEYVNLEKKLNFIDRNSIDVGFSHHPDIENIVSRSNTKFVFWPFAYDPRRFRFTPECKSIDLAFSGILQNLSAAGNQSDLRKKIMRKLFFSFLHIPLRQKPRYSDLQIYWKSIPRHSSERLVSRLLKKQKHLTNDQYARLIARSRIYLNTSSPLGLISPRFYECMASGALVFCEKNEFLDLCFPKGTYVAFEPDLSDFDELLSYFLGHGPQRIRITTRAHQFIQKHHTWRSRISQLLETMGFARC